jgi:hypothetical protein
VDIPRQALAAVCGQGRGHAHRPEFLKFDAFSERFDQHDLRVESGTLQKASWRWDLAACREAWRGELEEIGGLVKLNQAG